MESWLTLIGTCSEDKKSFPHFPEPSSLVRLKYNICASDQICLEKCCHFWQLSIKYPWLFSLNWSKGVDIVRILQSLTRRHLLIILYLPVNLKKSAIFSDIQMFKLQPIVLHFVGVSLKGAAEGMVCICLNFEFQNFTLGRFSDEGTSVVQYNMVKSNSEWDTEISLPSLFLNTHRNCFILFFYWHNY